MQRVTGTCSYCLRQIRNASSDATNAAAKPSSKPRAYVPPRLPRPLGIQHTERSIPLNREERIEDRIRRNQEKRHVLLEELKKGYFKDFKDVQDFGGKMWTAPETVIRADRALFFPVLQGTRLSDKATVSTSSLFPGKVSLVTTMSVQLSEEHINAYLKPLQPFTSSLANFQTVQLNVQDNPLKSFLLSMFLSSLKRTVPASQHDTYLLVTQNMELLREPMGMLNKAIGYVYLVDWKGRIRWAACAQPTNEELASLQSCITVLLSRLGQPEDS